MPSTKRILLAEDNQAMSYVVSRRLQSLGQQVLVTRDAAHALFLMHKEPPDLVIMDVVMPAGNGLAVCEMMRDDARLKDIPVIIITCLDDEATRERAQRLRAEYLAKSDDLWAQLRPLCAKLLNIDLNEPPTRAGPPRDTHSARTQG